MMIRESGLLFWATLYTCCGGLSRNLSIIILMPGYFADRVTGAVRYTTTDGHIVIQVYDVRLLQRTYLTRWRRQCRR